MQTMAVMIGIQASGKSTFCKRYLGDYVRVNLDVLHTRNKEKLAIEDAIASGEDIVIDNTNPMIADREKYILIGNLVLIIFLAKLSRPMILHYSDIIRISKTCSRCYI